MKFVVIAFFTVLSFASAQADEAGKPDLTLEEKVAAHSVVQSIATLLNDANENKCVVGDVQAYCMGAMLQVTKPTLVSNGCGFSVSINCENGAGADISGNELYTLIAEADGSTSDIQYQGVRIETVKLTPATK